MSDTAPQPDRVTDERPIWTRIYDWWNPPCPKHPGHRQREVDTEIATGCAMCDYPALMCSECFKEQESNPYV